MDTGKSNGMYDDNNPWLIPNIKASIPISMIVKTENDELPLNKRVDNTKHPPKQRIIALRVPRALAIHPEKNPPDNPPMPRIIILNPRSLWPSEFVNSV